MRCRSLASGVRSSGAFPTLRAVTTHWSPLSRPLRGACEGWIPIPVLSPPTTGQHQRPHLRQGSDTCVRVPRQHGALPSSDVRAPVGGCKRFSRLPPRHGLKVQAASTQPGGSRDSRVVIRAPPHISATKAVLKHARSGPSTTDSRCTDSYVLLLMSTALVPRSTRGSCVRSDAVGQP